LVVRQFDAQWVEAAQACVAVIAESGAELSNGAMILRTLGVPAMIAVRGCYDAMPTTTELVVAASYAYVEIKRALPNLLPQPRPVPMLPELGVTRAFRMITGEVRRD
jgi:signal transduction protein with GAF and PtsI domain